MSDTSEIEMRPILREIRDLNEEYPVGLIAIGGVAVYMHTLHDGRGRFAESTHDIDFFLSKENLGSLRDREELTAIRSCTDNRSSDRRSKWTSTLDTSTG